MNVRFLCGEKKDLNKVPLVKGKKGSTSKTITVYIPNWATIYYFL